MSDGEAGGEAADPADLWLSELREDRLERYVWHFDMLHHSTRNAAYAAAFRRLPQDAFVASPSSPSGSPLALDLGCGSGLLGLALLDQRPDQKRLKIIGIEADKLLAKVAQDNAASAGKAGRVEVRRCMSTKLKALTPEGQRARLVVSELFDSPLLGEGVLPTMRHAAAKLLAPGYYSVPCRAQVLAVVVESSDLKGLQCLNSPDDWLALPRGWRSERGDARPHETHLERLIRSGRARRLTGDFEAFSIDFENLPPRSGQHVSLTVRCEASGRADAVVFWWRCAMLRGDDWERQPPAVNNAPTGAGDPDHWRQAVCVLPAVPGGHDVTRGEKLVVGASHSDELIWFNLEHQHTPLPFDARWSPREPTSSLGSLTPWRLRMLNAEGRLHCLQRVVSATLRQATAAAAAGGSGRERRRRPRVVADLSEGGLLSALCLAQSTGQSASSSSSSGDAGRGRLSACTEVAYASDAWVSRKRRRLWSLTGAHRRQLNLQRDDLRLVAIGGGRAVARELTDAVWSLQTLRRRWSNKAAKVAVRSKDWRPARRSLSALLAEPYDEAIEQRECDLQLWQHWAQVQDLAPCLRTNAVVWPRHFRLRACLVSCAPLWQRRRPLAGLSVEGVDVSAMDRLASSAHFPWASEAKGEVQRRRFPCELWLQEHTVGRDRCGDDSDSNVLCSVDVLVEPLRNLEFEPVRLHLSEGLVASGVHALATWSEVWLPSGAAAEDLGEASWRPSATFDAVGAGEAERFAPGPYKQGMLLAHNPWHGSGREEAPGKRRKTANGASSSGSAARPKAPRWLDVRASFHPARGELRLEATWDDGSRF